MAARGPHRLVHHVRLVFLLQFRRPQTSLSMIESTNDCLATPASNFSSFPSFWHRSLSSVSIDHACFRHGRAHSYPAAHLGMLKPVTSDSKGTTKLKKIKPTGTRDFNVENPSNKEKKKPRAPVSNTSDEIINASGFTICVLSRAAAYKRYL